MDVLNEIYQTVDNIVQRRMEQSGLNNQIQAIVLGSSNGKYTISVNGAKYSVKDGVGINPQPNTPVWVCIPNNDWNKAYICAGNSTASGGSGNVDDVYQNGVSVLGEDHIARVRCATPEDIQQLQANFQDGVDSIYDACVTKGSTPESHALSDVVQGVLDIEGQGTLITKTISSNGTYNAQDDNADGYSSVNVSVIDDYYYVEPQVTRLEPIDHEESRIIYWIYFTLASAERVRFYSTLNFKIGFYASYHSADVTIKYLWDNTEESEPITQNYTTAGSKILKVDYLLPTLSAGNHVFCVQLKISGGDIL